MYIKRIQIKVTVIHKVKFFVLFFSCGCVEFFYRVKHKVEPLNLITCVFESINIVYDRSICAPKIKFLLTFFCSAERIKYLFSGNFIARYSNCSCPKKILCNLKPLETVN